MQWVKIILWCPKCVMKMDVDGNVTVENGLIVLGMANF